MAKSRSMAGTKPHVSYAKPIKIDVDKAEYLGYEPEYNEDTVTAENREILKKRAFNWYSYHMTYKDAQSYVVDYLKHNGRVAESKKVKKLPNHAIVNAVGWFARMTMMGWKLSDDERAIMDKYINEAFLNTAETAEEGDTADKITKLNIQDHIKAKTAMVAGEIEGIFDEAIDLIRNDKKIDKISPISVMRESNVSINYINDEIAHWNDVRSEFQAVFDEIDKELSEGYNYFTKSQLKKVIKFIDLIISDYNSYISFKKASMTPRRRKSKTPSQIVNKLRYMKEFSELKLKSIPPEKLVESKEIFLYNSKTRKLQYYIADAHAGNVMTVKGTTIVGFDVTNSAQKTIRKPDEFMKEFMAGGKPKSRSLFNDIKTVSVKVTGRLNDDIIILKAW